MPSLIDYRGLPYLRFGRDPDGVDCCGLPFLAFREVHGIEIEPHAGVAVGHVERAEAEALFRGELSSGRWRRIDRGAEREWDIAWFREPKDGRPTHVGIVMKSGWMLHAHEGAGLVVPERYGSGLWSRLLIGFQRNVELEARLAS